MATISSDKLREFLYKKGVPLLGRGAYSDVFGPVNSDRVIKVNRAQDKWLDYILWATRQGYAGTWAPKVYSFHIIDGHYVAIMERLPRTLRDADPALRHHFNAMEQFIGGEQWKPGEYTLHPETEKKFPGCAAFLKGLAANYRWEIDWHRGNIMERHDGSWCVTDPVTGAMPDTTPKRMRAHDIAWERNKQFANQKAYAKRA